MTPSEGKAELLDFAGLKHRQKLSERWLAHSVQSMLSLWNSDTNGARRDSEDLAESYRPTATSHCIVALGECGLWHEESGYEHRTRVLTTPYTRTHTFTRPPKWSEVLEALVLGPPSDRFPEDQSADGKWLLCQLQLSSHWQTDGEEGGGTEKGASTRSSIALERLLAAVRSLTENQDIEQIELRTQLSAGANEALRMLGSLCTEARTEDDLDPVDFYESPGFSPMIVLNLALALRHAVRILRTLQTPADTWRLSERDLERIERAIQTSVERHVDYHMARHGVQLDPSYDPVSLAFALRTLHLLAPTSRFRPFFHACVQAVVEGQNPDGCWPDGLTVTYEPTADVIQVPSVAVALALAESVIDDKTITDHSPEFQRLLDATLPSLRRMAQFLESSHAETALGDQDWGGWCSDRIRRPRYSEAWVTAMATRFFLRLWLGEKAAIRSYSLSHLGIDEHASQYLGLSRAKEEWDKTVVDPDGILRPAQLIWRDFATPVLRRRDAGSLIQRPQTDSVSFVLFGPPGSGKTFIVQKLAEVLGWPLVALNPGHFIRRGLELIEATSREIFEFLSTLEHAVVFFDECDELFRQRKTPQSGDGSDEARSILAFATASMLPKIQALRNSGNVLFVLGTNYLRNIDKAVLRPGRFDHLIFFDRPDHDARRQILEKAISPVDAADKLATVLNSTVGLTFKEVIAFRDRAERGEEVPAETSLRDYQEWTATEGKSELEASRMGHALIGRVRERWAQLV